MIRLTPAVEAALFTHAREGAPEEVCGVLGGTRAAERDGTDRDGAHGDDGGGGGDADVVTTLRRVANAADDPRSRYELDPGEQLPAMEDLADRSLDVVGFYHSHPRGPDGPSATDERLATWPDRVYLVVSLAGDEPAVGAWRWTGEAFDREAVTVAKDPEPAGEEDP